MTSRERVLAVFAHQIPDRVPAWCGASEGFWDKAKHQLHLEDESLRVRFGDDFRRVFARDASPPHIRRLVELGHQYGLKVMLHCCGGYQPLIPALIETGLDGLHALQSCCQGMDLARLKAAFGKKIILNGAIDSQHILLAGTPESVRESTRKVLQIMMPGGNYIAGASHDWILEETPVENVLSMFDAIREFGVYP